LKLSYLKDTMPTTRRIFGSSTFEANSIMREAGLDMKKRKEKRDQIAAQIILQGFIEAGYPEDGGYLGPLQG
jgi:TorA maturation chaperone TorD